MKRINSLILASLCIILGCNIASAFSKSEREAQTAIKNYLTQLGYSTQIDNKDNSVNFSYKGTLMYITFKEEGTGILYTLHRQALKFEHNDANENARRLENATLAANLMNEQFPYKTFVKGNRVNFEFPVYAATPVDYTKVFGQILKNMSNVKTQFDNCFDRAQVTTDSIHRYWAENNPNALVVPQSNTKMTVNGQNLTITRVDFKTVSQDGADISQYGDNIRKSDIKYIQPQVTVTATKKGIYHIGMVITTPNGKTLLPSPKADRTTVTTVEIDKKPTTVELTSFGNKDGDFWLPGEYKVTFYEDNRVIKETSFNIL